MWRGAGRAPWRADRRLIVAQRTGESLFCYAPAGPLTRADLEVVSEHFETLHLTGVLPGKEVEVGDTWKLDSLPSSRCACSTASSRTT